MITFAEYLKLKNTAAFGSGTRVGHEGGARRDVRQKSALYPSLLRQGR
ncbi:MAG: hypothetical protein LBQ12_02510 [Deltaproteobacteria bacterium]|nr:hypothetical protein [Deltaproteobacteria bacterium]